MSVYQLLWAMLRLALAGRFRDEVCVSVLLDSPDRSIGITGVITALDILPRRERFLIIDAVSEDPTPWHETPCPAVNPDACPNCPPGYDCERGIYFTGTDAL